MRYELVFYDMKYKVEYYEKNNVVLIKRVKSLENVFIELEGWCSNGIYFWRIKSYLKFRNEVELGEVMVIYSLVFYFSCFGYKICICVNLNGVDFVRGIYFFIFVYFM